MNTTLLINYIDQLRKERNLTQENFISDIISQRQYSRYKKGSNDVPFDIIIQLSDRLNLSLSHVITAFEQSISNEAQQVKEFFNYVVDRDIEKANALNKQLQNQKFIIDTLNSYYKLAQLLLNYYQKTITQNTLLIQLKKTLKYPAILEKTTLSDHEIYILGLIMQYDQDDIEPILTKLLKLDRLKHYVDIRNPYIIVINQFFIIKILGRLERFDDVIKYANETIEFCKNIYTNYMMEKFYYYKALAHFYLHQQPEFETALKETILEGLRISKYDQDKLFAAIKKDTNINPMEFIKNNIE